MGYVLQDTYGNSGSFRSHWMSLLLDSSSRKNSEAISLPVDIFFPSESTDMSCPVLAANKPADGQRAKAAISLRGTGNKTLIITDGCRAHLISWWRWENHRAERELPSPGSKTVSLLHEQWRPSCLSSGSILQTACFKRYERARWEAEIEKHTRGRSCCRAEQVGVQDGPHSANTCCSCKLTSWIKDTAI